MSWALSWAGDSAINKPVCVRALEKLVAGWEMRVQTNNCNAIGL